MKKNPSEAATGLRRILYMTRDAFSTFPETLNYPLDLLTREKVIIPTREKVVISTRRMIAIFGQEIAVTLIQGTIDTLTRGTLKVHQLQLVIQDILSQEAIRRQTTLPDQSHPTGTHLRIQTPLTQIDPEPINFQLALSLVGIFILESGVNIFRISSWPGRHGGYQWHG